MEARLETAAAIPAVTLGAALAAAGAIAVAAALAGQQTLAAERFVATPTGTSVIFIDRAVAIAARDAVPTIEFDVSGAFRVRVQNTIHDREEIEQSSFGQRRRDRSAPFAGAKPLAVDVRMRGFAGGDGRIRFERHDRIGRVPHKPLGIQADTERAQANILEYDRVGGDAERRVVDLQAAELLIRGLEFFVEHPNRRSARPLGGA